VIPRCVSSEASSRHPTVDALQRDRRPVRRPVLSSLPPLRALPNTRSFIVFFWLLSPAGWIVLKPGPWFSFWYSMFSHFQGCPAPLPRVPSQAESLVVRSLPHAATSKGAVCVLSSPGGSGPTPCGCTSSLYPVASDRSRFSWSFSDATVFGLSSLCLSLLPHAWPSFSRCGPLWIAG